MASQSPDQSGSQQDTFPTSEVKTRTIEWRKPPIDPVLGLSVWIVLRKHHGSIERKSTISQDSYLLLHGLIQMEPRKTLRKQYEELSVYEKEKTRSP